MTIAHAISNSMTSLTAEMQELAEVGAGSGGTYQHLFVAKRMYGKVVTLLCLLIMTLRDFR